MFCLTILALLVACGAGGAAGPVAEPPAQTGENNGQPASCQTLRSVNLRRGPGESYDPPQLLLPRNTALTPLAFSATGFPSGQWILVQVGASGETGWVSAGSQFVGCNVDLTGLPAPDTIPPTPEQGTEVVAVTRSADTRPPRVQNDTPGGSSPDLVAGEVIVDDTFLFRMQVADTRVGREDGAGIDHVEFFISDELQQVYFKRENDPGYCVFGGGVPDCEPWTVRDGRNFWAGDGPEVEPGSYHASILVFPNDPEFEGEVWNWDFDFTLSLP
jgi:hypothetical protein